MSSRGARKTPIRLPRRPCPGCGASMESEWRYSRKCQNCYRADADARIAERVRIDSIPNACSHCSRPTRRASHRVCEECRDARHGVYQKVQNGARSRREQIARIPDLSLCSWRGVSLTPEIASLDHVIPIATGGLDVPHNHTPACRQCNASKSDTPLLVWLAIRRLRAA